MILDDLSNAARYLALHPGLQQGFDFLTHARAGNVALGRHELDGDRVFALVEENFGRGHAGARLEAHRRYLDIQVVLTGREEIGWRPVDECHLLAEPYVEPRDIMFFADPPQTWIELASNQFMIFFPGDAHAPLAAEGPNTKVVVKIALA